MRRLPPLSAIEAFVATAEKGGVRAAASALGLSASAITRRIQLFERCAGAQMFFRNSDGVALTESGARMLERLAPALGAFRSAIAPEEREQPVRLRVSRSVAALWLTPRLGQEGARRKLHFLSDLSLTDLRDDKADLGIFHGERVGEDCVGDALIPLTVSVVGAPEVVKQADAARPKILGLIGQQGLWKRIAPGAVEAMRFDGIHAMFEAAAAGAGLALGLSPLVDSYLADRRLVVAEKFGQRPGGAYHLIATRRALQRRGVAEFRNWLLEAAAQTSQATAGAG